jgi:hypothetical protein
MAERAVNPGFKETTANQYRDNDMAAALERRGITDPREQERALRVRAERLAAAEGQDSLAAARKRLEQARNN